MLSTSAPLVLNLAWGLGDVLLSTSAIRRYKELHPDVPIVYRTYKHNQTDRYRLSYAKGTPAQMLQGNPDIDGVIDWFDPVPARRRRSVMLRYAWFGGPSLDYPIQAHYWENLELEWQQGQRFDCFYYVTDEERMWAREWLATGPLLALTPHGGWPGKMWRDDGWAAVIRFALEEGMTPVVLAGDPLHGRPWDQRGVLNLSGQLDIRQSAAILEMADHAVMIEGGMSNLRFALGKPVILLTCATQVGLQIWTPPELTTEVRMVVTGTKVHPIHAALRKGLIDGVACEPCMWRRDHVKTQTRNVAPASLKQCPKGRSLRDVPAQVVIDALKGETHGRHA